MKIVGIITELNPFTNGHNYIINEAKKVTKADYVALVMSPDYVQRGEPAIFNKYLRTKIAIENGADIVIELPVEYATSSAQYFANASILLLKEIGVSDIVFGSEIDNINLLKSTAKILYNEPEQYRISLKENLKKGMSFPKARSNALLSINSEYASVIGSNMPNATLGIEYIQASIRNKLNLNFHTIKRIGGNYNDTEYKVDFPSASALRKNIIFNNQDNFLTLDDFSLILKTKLINETSNSLTNYFDVDNDLANSIINYKYKFNTISRLIELLKTKNRTYSKISRCLLHIILDIKNNIDTKPSYIKILGVNKNKIELLGIINKNSTLPVIANKKDADKLSLSASELYNLNINSSLLYETIYSNKYNKELIHEYNHDIRY